MSKYLHLFNSTNDFQAAYNGNHYEEPWVSLTTGTGELNYNKDIGNNGHGYVYLGLPSGTVWAKKNVGSATPYDVGTYFAWGATRPTNDYSYSNYPYATAYDNVTKYNASDQIETLELTDDAAHVNMGGLWHMPSVDQINELIQYTNQSIVYENGVYCVKFTCKVMDSLYILFPLSGYKNETYTNGSDVTIWSNEVTTNNNEYYRAQYLVASVYDTYGDYYFSGVETSDLTRAYGLNVRGVMEIPE